MMNQNRKTILALLAVLLTAGLLYAYHSYQEYLRIERERHEEAMRVLNELIAGNTEKAETIARNYESFQSAEYEKENDPLYREESVGTLSLNLDAIGDSVMLGAAQLLKETFPNAYVDAAVNRSYYPLLQIVSERYEEKILGDPVVIGIGTNGPLSVKVCHQVLDLCKERHVFWITTTNNTQFYNTDTILSFAQDYDNVTIIDWDIYSKDHPEYFYRDGIHLPPAGRQAYVTLIKDTITETLWNEMPHEKHRVLLAGDGSLATCTDLIESLDENGSVFIREDITPQSFQAYLEELDRKHILPERIVLCTKDEELAKACIDYVQNKQPDTEINAVLLISETEGSAAHDSRMISYNLTEESDEIYAEDQIHLNEDASRKLSSYLLDLIAR